MLDIRFVRENLDLVRRKMLERGKEVDFDLFVSLETKRRDLLQEVENLRSDRNRVSKEIGKKKQQKEDASDLIARMGEVSTRIKELDEERKDTESRLQDFMMMIPNIFHESVVYGTGSEDNPVVRTWGGKPVMKFVPKPHWEIGEDLGILDFARGAKIAGARFTVYRGLGARLERAVINFMLDLHTGTHCYTELLTPFMVNRESMTGTGQLPKFAEDLFKIEGMEYYLIPTAEVPVT
ncbi:MAG TPA: serine--tRNA ligase, partial [Syntrophales bacterium]|nr:serine--tRNA ligase [Syntrophales bacterium]